MTVEGLRRADADRGKRILRVYHLIKTRLERFHSRTFLYLLQDEPSFGRKLAVTVSIDRRMFDRITADNAPDVEATIAHCADELRRILG